MQIIIGCQLRSGEIITAPAWFLKKSENQLWLWTLLKCASICAAMDVTTTLYNTPQHHNSPAILFCHSPLCFAISDLICQTGTERDCSNTWSMQICCSCCSFTQTQTAVTRHFSQTHIDSGAACVVTWPKWTRILVIQTLECVCLVECLSPVSRLRYCHHKHDSLKIMTEQFYKFFVSWPVYFRMRTEMSVKMNLQNTEKMKVTLEVSLQC